MYQRRGKPKPVHGTVQGVTVPLPSTSKIPSPKKIVRSTSIDHEQQQWTVEYDSPPIINREMIWFFGMLLFVFAYVWPPSILFVTFIAGQFIPYAFRTNDDAVERRKNFKKFFAYKKHPEKFHHVQQFVNFREKYWENNRYVFSFCTMLNKENR